MDAQTAFSKFVHEAGGRAEAAKRLGITVGMVGHVINGVRSISIDRAREIEAQTKGRISRSDLRPDVYGPNPSLPNNALPIGVPNGEHPVRHANDRNDVLGAGRSK